jgi:hypothetical protein
MGRMHQQEDVTVNTTGVTATEQQAHPVGSIDDRVGGLFVPDTMAPTQYFDRLRGGLEAQSGERRLMIAILEDAVLAYLKHAGDPRKVQQELFREAEAWVESDDRSWIFAFASICEHLGLEPSQLRRGLRVRKAQALAGEQPSPVPLGLADVRDAAAPAGGGLL